MADFFCGEPDLVTKRSNSLAPRLTGKTKVSGTGGKQRCQEPGENKGVRNRIRQLQRETVPDTFIVLARMDRREVLAEGDSGVPSDKTVYVFCSGNVSFAGHPAIRCGAAAYR